MDNNCKLLTQNGLTQSREQVCAGDYNGKASVNCYGSDYDIVGITDTDGNSYTCNPTRDGSCNALDGGFGDYVVSSCCYRN